MKTPFVTKSLSPAARRRVELAIAVAQERLLNTHVEHALDLITLVGVQVPFDDALEIYNRLLRLSIDETRIITTRALATIGERGEEAQSWPERVAESETTPEDHNGRRSLLRNLRQRLRGRINDELRQWIEIEAAKTEVALLETHVENALNFVDILEKELLFNEAVELYLEALEVRDSLAEVVYYITLSRLSQKILPAGKARQKPRPERLVATVAEERRLRVVESDGA